MEGAAARASDVMPAPGDVLQPCGVRQYNHHDPVALLSYPPVIFVNRLLLLVDLM
jgi:hypothetical protein